MNKSKLINSTESVVMPVNSLKSSYEKRELIVNKDYQRDCDWNKNQRSKLIVSIFDNYPLGEILRNRMYRDTEDGIQEEYFELVDGQQRMVYSIFSFINNEFSLSKEDSKYIIECYYVYFSKKGNVLNVKKMFDKYEKGEEVSLKYKNLPEKLQDKINSFNISVRTLNYSDYEEIKEYFRRVQQGTPLKGEQIIHTIESELNNIIKNKLSKNESVLRFFNLINERGVRKKNAEIKIAACILEVLALYHDGRNLGTPKDLPQWVGKQNDETKFLKSIDKVVAFLNSANENNLKFKKTAGKSEIKLLTILILYSDKISVEDIFNIVVNSNLIKTYHNKINDEKYGILMKSLVDCGLDDVYNHYGESLIRFSMLRAGSHDSTKVKHIVSGLENSFKNKNLVLV